MNNHTENGKSSVIENNKQFQISNCTKTLICVAFIVFILMVAFDILSAKTLINSGEYGKLEFTLIIVLTISWLISFIKWYYSKLENIDSNKK